MNKISVEEKIYLENKLPQPPKEEIMGPSTDLFFHELVHEEESAQKYLTKLLGILLFLINLVLFPVIALSLVLSGVTRILVKENCIGYRGKPIQLWKYRTKRSSGITSPVGRFLKKYGFYKLPMSVNLITGDILLAGPRPFSEEASFDWNNRFDEFYKRYAVKPGFFIIGDRNLELDDAAMTTVLAEEFKYLYKPSIEKDIQIIVGQFSS